MRQDGGTWTAFLVMAFIVVGMAGVFASYAAQVPLQQALIHSDALDQAVVAHDQPNGATELEKLRPELGDAADTIISGRGDFASRIATQRARLRLQDMDDAGDIAFRLRLLVTVSTIAASLFGAAVLSISRRAPA